VALPKERFPRAGQNGNWCCSHGKPPKPVLQRALRRAAAFFGPLWAILDGRERGARMCLRPISGRS
jgi:hypothetical protein